MSEQWNPQYFAQGFLRILDKYFPDLEKEWLDTNRRFSERSNAKLAEQLNVNPAFLTGITNMLREEDGRVYRHKQPRESTIHDIAKAVPLNTEECRQLLIMAGYVSYREDELKESPFLATLLPFFDDAAIPEFIKENLENDMAILIEGWRAYAKATVLLHQRRWQDVIDTIQKYAGGSAGQLQQLPGYLLDIEAITRLHRNETDEAMELLNSPVIASIPERRFPYLRASILLHRGDAQREKAQWDKAQDSYDEAAYILDHVTGSLDQRTDADVHNKIRIRAKRKRATVKLFKGEWRYVSDDLEECLRRFGILEDRYELARTHQNLGWAYDLEGNWEKSFSHRWKAFLLAHRHKINGVRDYYLLALSGVHLATDYRQRHDLKRAKKAAHKALDRAQDHKEQRYEWFAYLELAQIYRLMWLQAIAKGQESQERDTLRKKAREYAESAHKTYPKHSRYHHGLALAVYGEFCLADAMQYPEFLAGNFDPAVDSYVAEQFGEAKTSLEDARQVFFQLQCYWREAAVHVQLIRWHLATSGKSQNVEIEDRITQRIQRIEQLHQQYHYPQLMAQALILGATHAIRTRQIRKAVKQTVDAWYYANEFNGFALIELEDAFYALLHELGQRKELPKEEYSYLLGDTKQDDRSFAALLCGRVADLLVDEAQVFPSTTKRQTRVTYVAGILQKQARRLGRDANAPLRTEIEPQNL